MNHDSCKAALIESRNKNVELVFLSSPVMGLPISASAFISSCVFVLHSGGGGFLISKHRQRDARGSPALHHHRGQHVPIV